MGDGIQRESRTPTICGDFPIAQRGGLSIGRLGIFWQHPRMVYPRSHLVSDEEPPCSIV